MLLGAKEQEAVKQRLSTLTGQVKMVLFETAIDCAYCPQTKQLVEEIAALSPKLEVEVHNFRTDEDAVAQYGVKQVPAIVLVDEHGKDYGIRFYGIPSGYEFATLLEDIEMISTQKTSLSQKALDALQSLATPVHLQVFVTPT
ncbi:MAG: thioredoxin family protein [Firmicutes bacterium]|nr:thioredoxin family protein [Bacillota bacterium]